MKKRLLTAFMIVLFFAAFAAGLNLIKAYSYEMSYSETINQDTTWTKANSPINLPGNVLVSKGATLTIEAGVTVNCAKNVIQVNGTLKVLGSNDDKVVFHTNNRVINGAHEPSANINFGDESSDCVIENAVLETMGFTYYNCQNSITINNNYFKDQTATTNSGSTRVLPTIRGSGKAIITNNIFNGRIQLACSASVINNTFSGGGVDASDGSFLILNNTLTGYPSSPWRDGFGVGIERCQKAVIADNHFSNYVEACIKIDGPALIQRNFIQNTPTDDQFKGYPFFGIQVEGSSPLIENNTITNTGIGIDLYDQGFILTRPIIKNNNIYNNVNFNLYLGGYPTRHPEDYTVSNINAANNYWGSTDQAISQKIHDSKYQSNLGTVNIDPVLTAPNPNAMPNSNAPAPTLDQVPPAKYYKATKDNSQSIILTKIGNLTIYPSDRINVTTNLFPASTNITFLMRGDPGHYDFGNLTIPRSAIPYGTTPKVYFDNQLAEDQGYSQDAGNYYVWCTTHFDVDEYFFGRGTIVFADAQTTQTITTLILGIIAAAIIATVAALTIFLLWRRKRKTRYSSP